MAKKKKLSARQTRFVKALAHGKTQAQAAIDSGYSGKNPRQVGHQIAQRLHGTFAEVMEAHGLTDDVLLDKYLLPAMEAEETQYIVIGGVKKPRIREKKRPLWHARLRALDISFLLKGSYAPLKVDTQERKTVSVILLDRSLRPPRPGLPDAGPIEVRPVNGNGKPTNGNKGNGTGHD
jgi:hypothetical protein